MIRILWTAALAGVVLSVGEGLRAEGPEAKGPGFELKDGDRVVLLGNAFFERDHEYGYLETELTSIWPDREITFRNLGRTGDTVWGDAWAGFETPVEGFQRRRDLVLGLKPTVLLVAFGMNESFAGEPGLPKFVEGLNALLDSLAPTKARIVLISPTVHEKLPPPLPDPAEHNHSLRLYRDAMAKVAHDRGLGFVDLLAAGVGDGLSASGNPRAQTDDGIHLNAYGYQQAARTLGEVMGYGIANAVPAAVQQAIREVGEELTPHGPLPWALRVRVQGKSHLEIAGFEFAGLSVQISEPGSLGFQVEDNRLPDFLARKNEDRRLVVSTLPPGRYTLKIDGQKVVTATHLEWADGVAIGDCPERRQAEALRQAIVAKNRLLYYRWRPENSTYLYGFRKHEQGQNAAEIPEFDPLVAEKEAEIAKLRKPVSHVYELAREKEDGR